MRTFLNKLFPATKEVDAQTPADVLIAEAFWIILGREINDNEMKEVSRGFHESDIDALALRLLSSPEFKLIHDSWREDRPTGRNPRIEENGLRRLGSDEHFVERAYELLLGRPVDPDGLHHVVSALRSGERRTNALRSLVT